MGRISLIGLGICGAVLAIAAAGGCRRDPSKPFVEWAAEACSCTNRECADELQAELPELYEGIGMQLIDKRMVVAEEAGATCLEIQGVEIERRLARKPLRKNSAGANP
jgi:hypothetical protein